MAAPPVPPERVELVKRLYAEHRSTPKVAAILGVSDSTIHRILVKAGVPRDGHMARWEYQEAPPGIASPEPPQPQEKPFAVDHKPPASFIDGHVLEITSRPDNTFIFGAAGDLHAGSKYTRWDVREDLYRQFIEAGAQCSFDTGNWIDGDASFNRYDVEATGLDRQCRLLAERHPKGLPTYAIWGDDHEGWYVQREGVDVGRYCESIMREAGHEWTNLGFMEAHVLLKNANRAGDDIELTLSIRL